MTKLRDRRISQRTVDGLSVEEKDAVFWDCDLPGFGVRVYPNGTKVYVVQTRGHGRSKRVTIGRHGLFTADEARRRAVRIIINIKDGEHPTRSPANKVTVTELAERYLREHVAVYCRPSTEKMYASALRRFILPAYGHLPVGVVQRDQVADLHYHMRDKPYQANRVLEIASKMFNLAELWRLRRGGSNPCRFVRKYAMHKRERFLSESEFRRLGKILTEMEAEGSLPFQAAAALRLLMLTGCRKTEIVALRWQQVDFEAGELRLVDAKTGPRLVPLSPPVRWLLLDLPRVRSNPWVIPGFRPGRHLSDLNHYWDRVRERAGLEDVRIHDLRHSFASRAVALGENLSMIGQLLGHGQVRSTTRYTHLARDAVKASASRVAGSIGSNILEQGGPAGTA